MRFAIHYLTEYRYDEPVTDNLNVLRVTPAATPTQEVEDFRVQVDPEARLHRHTDYFGDAGGGVRHHAAARAPDHRRPGARGDERAAGAARRRLGRRSATRLRARRAPSTCCRRRSTGRWDDTLAGLRAAIRGDTPADTVRALCELIPDRFEYRAGRHLRRLDGRGPAGGRRGRLPGLRAPRAGAAARPGDRGALRLGLLLRAGAGRRRRRLGRGPDPRVARGAAARRRTAASRAGRAPTRRTGGWPARST